MVNGLDKYTEVVFDNIRHVDEDGNEFWYARELMEVLEYSKWRNFNSVIESARLACSKSNNSIHYHFAEVGKMIKLAKGASRKVLDYKLSRYACYLIVQNADSRKEVVALGQTYFAVQTRKMEITEEEYLNLSETDKRFYRRKQTKDGNRALYAIAKEKGVKNFDKFTNAGYKGLYNGETANDIAKRKGLIYREEILDNMGSEELGANVFRITQTEALLKKQEEKSEIKASDTHYRVGVAIRNTIKDLGGTMPEDLPTPEKSLKQIEKERKKTKDR